MHVTAKVEPVLAPQPFFLIFTEIQLQFFLLLERLHSVPIGIGWNGVGLSSV